MCDKAKNVKNSKNRLKIIKISLNNLTDDNALFEFFQELLARR